MNDDEMLAHKVMLASITAECMLSPEYDPFDYDDHEPVENVVNCHRLLAEAFVGLVKKHGEQPKFRVKAGRAVIRNSRTREQALS